MFSSSFRAGLFGSIFVALLLLVLSVDAAPVSLEERGGTGPKLCGKPLKIPKYRDVCLGLLDPITGQVVNGQVQEGLAYSNYLEPLDPLVWLQPNEMAELRQNLNKGFSAVHCDHVLEVQYILRLLEESSSTICANVRKGGRFARVLDNLVKVVNSKDNLLLLDGEINKLKGRYTTRVMTSNKYKVAPTLPELEDRWLVEGAALYFSHIREQQLTVAGEIYDTVVGAAGKTLGTRNDFLSRVHEDFTTLNEFFQKAFLTHPDASGWITPASETNSQPSLETISLMEAELQESFQLDDEDQEPLLSFQSQHLESEARLAVSTQNPPRLLPAQCKRFSVSETDSNGSPACELPNRTGLQSAVNNNTNLNDEVDTLPASSPNLLPSTPIFSEPELESSTFLTSSSPPPILPSSKSVLGNLNRPVASSVPTVVTQHRTPLRASPTILSSFRQSPVNHFYSVSKSPIYYPRPIPTRVRSGRILTSRIGFIPTSTKKQTGLGGLQ